MKRRLRVYKKTVSIVNETATGMYESLVGDKKGFLLESYDKNYDRYTFFGKEPEEIISSRGNALVITKNDGTQEVRNGNPLERLKEYYSEGTFYLANQNRKNILHQRNCHFHLQRCLFYIEGNDNGLIAD